MSYLDNIDPTPIDYQTPTPQPEPNFSDFDGIDRALFWMWCIIFGCLIGVVLGAG